LGLLPDFPSREPKVDGNQIMNLYTKRMQDQIMDIHMKGLFGRAPAPPKTALAPAPLVERLFWWSWSRFKKMFDKTASPSCVRWITG
jgi:hypothetical protein